MFCVSPLIDYENGMSDGFGYKFGQILGFILFATYLFAALITVIGNAYAASVWTEFQAWYFWILPVLACLVILWLIPRPIDLFILSPTAIYGLTYGWSLTWTVAGLLVFTPVIIVGLLSMGKNK